MLCSEELLEDLAAQSEDADFETSRLRDLKEKRDDRGLRWPERWPGAESRPCIEPFFACIYRSYIIYSCYIQGISFRILYGECDI